MIKIIEEYKRHKEAEEKASKQLLSNLDNAFAVLGDGWQMDETMNKMFDECVKAARKYKFPLEAKKINNGK